MENNNSKMFLLDCNKEHFDQIKEYRCAVLLSSYNGTAFITEQINSILNQKNVKVDIYIRDDGSNDETRELLEDFKVKYKDKISLIFGENRGIHGSFANLMEITPDSYDYYAFSDQDDSWDNDKLYVAISCLESKKCDFYSCSSRLVDSELKDLGRTTESKKTYEFYMKSIHKVFTPGAQGCTMVITNKLFSTIKRIGIVDNVGHDTWIPIIAYYFYSCIYDVTPHMNYRQHGNSWTGDRKNRLKQFCKSIKQFNAGMTRYGYLSKLLVDKCSDLLSKEELSYLIGLYESKGFFRRIGLLFKFHYRKKGVFSTIVLRIKYIFGKLRYKS